MRIGIAMSGGVDSTATAITLQAEHEVYGFFMQLAQPNFAEQLARVQSIADKLSIKLQVIDLRKQFDEQVLKYFSSSYFKGLTPNPCVICNREIKFGLFLDAILAAGMDKMATGHYARLIESANRFRLFKGVDPYKDQTYFLSRLSQQQLAKVIFPLGGSIKEDTYTLVEKHGFNDFRGQESQDVCFLENDAVGDFLSQYKGETSENGPIVDTSGKILGTHDGIFRYTIGQRKGLGISAEKPLYVLRIDAKNNAVVVGGNDELFHSRVETAAMHWLSGEPPDVSKTYTVRIRYTHKGSEARLILNEDNSGCLEFSEPQRAITPGQFAVVYDGDELLGSGIIL